MSTDLSYDEYIRLAPILAKKLVAILRKTPNKTMQQISAEIGITQVTLMNFLKVPDRRRKFSVLVKIENYIKMLEENIKE